MNSIIGFQFILKAESNFWSPFSTFIGSLAGALITGGLAIYLSRNEIRRSMQKENNDAIRNVKIINHYLDMMDTEFQVILSLKVKFDEIPDPWSEVDFIEDIHGESHPAYFPPQEWLDDYKRKIEPISSVARESAKKFIEEFRKMLEVDTSALHLEQLDDFLNIIAKMKIHILPIFNRVSERGKINITAEELEEINSLLRHI